MFNSVPPTFMRRALLLLLAVATLAAFFALPAGPVEASQTCQAIHVVQRGENLYRIALRYNTSWTVLAQVNNIANPDRIYPGQRLCIPAGTGGTGTVVNAYYLNVRSGPGVQYGVVHILSGGAGVQLLGRNSNSTWVNVRAANGHVGWVNAYYISSSIPIGSLPVLAAGAPPATVATH